MREIIFRGKKLESGEWITGGYFKHINRMLHPAGDRISLKDVNHLIIQSGFADWGMPRSPIAYEVDPETVGQWIGVNDIEGTKIFEGDILEIRDDDVHYRWVKWFSELRYPEFGFKNGAKLERVQQMTWPQVVEKAYYRVVGNIYDNPELLEGGEA